VLRRIVGHGVRVGRRYLPHALLPLLVRVRTWLAWRRPEVRAQARQQMGFLLQHVEPQPDLEAVARRYVERMTWRSELRWQPSLVVNERWMGLEHLVEAQSRGRGVMLACMHHGNLGGGSASLAKLGFPCCLMSYGRTLANEVPWIRQQLNLTVSEGGALVSTAVGSAGIAQLLEMGEIVAMAMDVPGRTPVTFAGHQLTGSAGVARIPFETGTPVVSATLGVDEHGTYAQLHEPLDPQSFESPEVLLRHLLAVQEESVLRYPEYVDLPTSRWVIPQAPETAQAAAAPEVRRAV
jgi:lauroyl/myristoyl acyltransferase